MGLTAANYAIINPIYSSIIELWGIMPIQYNLTLMCSIELRIPPHAELCEIVYIKVARKSRDIPEGFR